MHPSAIDGTMIDAHGGPERAKKVRFVAPEGIESFAPVDVIVVDQGTPEACIRIPWELDDGDLVKLADGHVLWLTIEGTGLPPHSLQVGYDDVPRIPDQPPPV